MDSVPADAQEDQVNATRPSAESQRAQARSGPNAGAFGELPVMGQLCVSRRKNMLVRGLAILFGAAALVGCALVVGAWFSWLELSSEAYAFSDAQFAAMRQEHWFAFKLWGSVALLSGLVALVLAWRARKSARLRPTKRSS